MRSAYTLEGTWEQVKAHETELKGKWVSVFIQPLPTRNLVANDTAARLGALKGRGAFAHLPEGSEEFAARKAIEKARE